MRRRIFSLVLAASMLATMLTGCGGGGTYKPTLPTAQEEAEIYVQKIDGLSEDFIKGVDISSLLVEEASGVKYYNEAGEEEDLLKILADAGVNYVRVRVWNDPFDEEGHGYGGGNCTAQTAAEIGRRAAKYGMKINVDFHYSDFWADPRKQMAPKAWKELSTEEKADALYAYTKDSLNEIIKAGADVGIVQIGNETNNGMAGEKSFKNIVTLMKSGSKAVREVSPDIKIAVHYTAIDNYPGTLEVVGKLKEAELDFDIFGVSYYNYWDGTQDNMEKVLTDIKSTYGVDTCVMETSYPFTVDDGDESGNSVSERDLVEGYPASPQGQANCVRDLMARASKAGSLGLFYWEGAWVPVGSSHDSNSKIWEEFGSGWASSYASEYDPKDAGKYYGGSSWDNQAFFDFKGHVLPSLNVFKYVNYGAVGKGLEVIGLKDVYMEIGVGETLELPDKVEAFYNDSSCTDLMPVTWDAAQVAAIDTKVADTYSVTGTAESGDKLKAKIKVANINYVKNPSFEDEDMSMWNVVADGNDPTDRQQKASDAVTGDYSYHFWDTSAISFKLEQTISGLAAGTYSGTANIQGGDVGNDAEIKLYVIVGDQTYESDPVTLTGWVAWKTPKITGIEVDGSSDVIIGVSVKAKAEGWGTIDDFELFSQN